MTDIQIETKGAIAATKVILAGLRAYNEPHLGKRRADKKLVFTARDEGGRDNRRHRQLFQLRLALYSPALGR